MTSENTPTAVITDQAVAAREFTAPLSATRRGARLARLLALHQLDEWGCPYDSEPSDAAAAIVAELAANAATHGRVPGRDFGLNLTLAARVIRIEVADTCSEGRPSACPAPPASDSETGRGLLLVAALATRWGVADRQGPGKVIWAEIEF
ncbi:ATP-binding protein [Streptomyces sp. H10-C2]|uniref:ATP-binding protein n=1 Tax=unclassified Streptomyces TaxID=2593676 RepID=UPI0024BBADC5|nr:MULTISPECIES: ATP-binding protein [unclassified Streptomyces]MDJ0345474.1 ATP-binding protein [Streptomyces sp. PH10-H1]MDJ0374262.1 ATP-binding protein [Streptomyces sp. H10-C2]